MLHKTEFKHLFDSYFEMIRNFAFYRCGDTETASDIAQEIFLKIWEKREQYKATNMKPLLYKMANEMVISHYRKEVCRNGFKRNLMLKDHLEISPEDRFLFEEFAESYAKALSEMPEKQRIVFLMNRENNLKYKEIAEYLQISVKAVEKRMSAAIRFLKTELL
ncbi:MAG: RNA polymerase sigma-70 factor [Candidatus Symbiothrix sp.]|jgi:RNA polymerase sigma-70 factor (ECF subfamily)|nr:RNA polymerase sigma-70 factor [Candidatus Symbiothrix sp.]